MFKLFKNLTKKDVITILISVVLIVFQVWLDLKLPDYMSEITRLVQTEGSTINDILVQGGYMLACAGGSLIAMIIVGYLTSSVSANFSRTLGKKVFEKVQGFSMEETNYSQRAV